MSAPFCGKAVVIARSSGPPGSGSFTMLSARAVTGIRVAAPAAPRKRRRVDRDGTENRLSTLSSPNAHAQTWAQGDRFLALQTAQASGVGGYVGWRAEQENWIVGRLDPIRHDKGIVVDLMTAGLH